MTQHHGCQLVNLIREIENQVKHLRRSNAELQAAGCICASVVKS